MSRVGARGRDAHPSVDVNHGEARLAVSRLATQSTVSATAEMTITSARASAPLPASTDVQKLKDWLYNEHRIEVPVIDWHGRKFVRVSIQGYNSRRDVDALTEALKRFIGT